MDKPLLVTPEETKVVDASTGLLSVSCLLVPPALTVSRCVPEL
jgi:hypothetical protein